jgi:hypothetical protein
MLAGIQERIRQRSPYLPGRAERAVVVAAVEHRPAPIEDAIHGASQTRGKALHSVRKGCGALRFDEQMDVIVLERVVDDAEVRALRDRAETAPPREHPRRDPGGAAQSTSRAPRCGERPR